jgi:Asp-tRNA(Asn)/Glu-tRNA(Gln) amidotransferase A subunit family amidase
LDHRFAQGGVTGPLHCIPAIVKDNFETIGLQSADGSLSLQGFISNKDAFLVRKIKEAGAIVLAKSNMAEFAFSPYETVNSILPGYTRNPYALDRVTAGSSGGTAVHPFDRLIWLVPHVPKAIMLSDGAYLDRRRIGS